MSSSPAKLSFAKKEAKQGAAKLPCLPYERVSLQPVLAILIAKSSISARDTWVLGMGPLQYGTIYDGTRFAGSRVVKGQSVAWSMKTMNLKRWSITSVLKSSACSIKARTARQAQSIIHPTVPAATQSHRLLHPLHLVPHQPRLRPAPQRQPRRLQLRHATARWPTDSATCEYISQSALDDKNSK